MAFNSHLEKLVALNLSYVASEFIPLLKNKYAQVGVKEVLDRVQLSVESLANGNSDLTAIWSDLSTDPEVLDAVRGILNDLIQEIDNDQFRNTALVLVEPVVLSLSAVSDTVKPNEAQLKKIWNDFVQSPEFLTFALVALDFILERFVKNEKTRKFISNLLTAFVK